MSEARGVALRAGLVSICGLAMALLLLTAGQGRAQAPCARETGDVAVGGLNPVATLHSLASLADPANTVLYRATCRARLYLHWVGWIVLSDAERRALANAVTSGFGNLSLETDFYSSAVTGQPALPLATSPIDTPGNMVNTISNPTTAYTYFTFLLPWLIGPDEVHLNGFKDSCLSASGAAIQNLEWRQTIDAYRASGVRTVSVVFSPNNWGVTPCAVTGRFSDPAWNDVKDVALYGGGLTLDTPPYYFFAQPAAYRVFVEDEIRWAKAHKVKLTIIVSPPADDTVARSVFANQTPAFVSQLAADSRSAAELVPDAYVAEDYNPFQDPADPTVPGSENSPDGVTAVGLWLAQHAPTTRHP